jgi:hypothetical protein
MRARSNSAIPAKMWSCSRPAGVPGVDTLPERYERNAERLEFVQQHD